MHRSITLGFGLLAILVMLNACGSGSTPLPTILPSTPIPPTAEPTDTPLPTKTPPPTNTPKPTSTPKPTNTPRPTATSTPMPTPISLSGRGDDIVTVEKWDGPALAHIEYSSGGNFSIWNYGPDNDKIDLLVNTIGNYEGTVPLDFLDGEQTARFEINAAGPWTIEIVPLQQIRRIPIPGKFDGNGDDVVYLEGAEPDIMDIDASKADGNFSVWGYGDSRDLLVNDIAPYTGKVIIGNGMRILVIGADGPWYIDVTTR